ncbi:MAG TPA: GNAT family N-acetyltransferase [Anaerolineales bacterium]|nr:GNAT family N-acetyltransferase [Anaerolineales bacterium]
MDANKFKIRAAAWSDLEAVTELMRVVLTADDDAVSAVTSEELEREWKSEGFTLETDAFVAVNEKGQVVGFEEFGNRHAHASLQGDGYVHPDFRGLGIGTALLRALDERACREMQLAESDVRVTIMNGMSGKDQASREIHESEGYQLIRYHWMMEVDLTEAPKIAAFPDGIELRPFVKGVQDYVVFQAEDDAFRDHWGHVPGNFNNWKLRKLEREEFDPALWHIAWDGEQIAGLSLTRYRNGIGWIGTLGVRRPWRKRGLGEALLLHSFNEFYKRGMLKIGLSVDASNPTGATRLYQKVGMQVAVEDVIYEKELRPGRQLEIQE